MFLNPVVILGFENAEIQGLDSVALKKAKKKIYAEIELSDDGYIEYNGKKLTKSDVDNLVNELDDKEKLEFYFFLSQQKDLSNFLAHGDLEIFKSFRQESIYKLPSFVDFISPHFSDSYNKVSSIAFKNNSVPSFKAIISVPPVVNHQYLDRSFTGISFYLRDSIKDIDSLALAIENEESDYDDDNLDEIIIWVKKKLNVSLINILPAYFQSQRNQVAQSIRNLSVNTFNTFGNSAISIEILEYALKFVIDGITKEKIQGDYKQLKEIDNKRIKEEAQAPFSRNIWRHFYS